MTTTIGKVEYLVGADGKLLEREIRRVGAKAGKTGGNAAAKNFQQAFDGQLSGPGTMALRSWSQKMAKQGKSTGLLTGDAFSKALFRTIQARARSSQSLLANLFAFEDDGSLDKYAKRFDNVTLAIGDLEGHLRTVQREGRMTDATFRDISERIKVWGVRALEAERQTAALAESQKKLGNELDDNSTRVERFSHRMTTFAGQLDRHQSLWKRLSANTRQWTLIVGAVIASFGELAGLGSAAGSGLFVLAGAFSSAILGVGSLIAAFVYLNKDLKDLPAAVRPAAAAFGRLKESFGGLQEEIGVNAFSGTEGAFDSLTRTVKALRPAFAAVGKSINRLVTDLASGLAPGTKSFENLYGFVEKSAPIFERLMRVVGKLGNSLLTAFNRPSMQRAISNLLGYVELLFDRFDNFVNSRGFDEWLEHGERIFGAFGKLLDTTGRLLNDMVTDTTVKQLTDFIGHIDGFLQGGGRDIIDFAQKLDLFGLLAKMLDKLGKALEPLAGPMADFAEGLNSVVNSGIDTLSGVFNDVAKALAPFVQALADFVKNNPKLVADSLLAIAAGFVAIKAVGIATNITKGLAGFIGLASTKNTNKLHALAGAIAGVALAWAGAAATANADPKTEGGAAGGGLFQSIAGGALTGATIGSVLPVIGTGIGALIGAVGGLLSNAITSMLSDQENVWKNGLSQLFDPSDYSGDVIGPIKRWWNEDMVPIFENGWQQLSDFFTVSIPKFFSDIIAPWQNGWNQLATFFEETRMKFENGWNQIVSFFTVSIPGFFASIGPAFQNGWNQITNWFETNVLAKFRNGWNQIVNFFTKEIPRWGSQVWTNIVAAVGTWKSAFEAGFQKVWATIVVWFTKVANKIGTLLGLISQGQAAGSNAGASIGTGLAAASGTVLTRPTRLLAGEDGPEAIVPLRRSLSRVDPSVRWLSALAQGKSPAMASGGIVGGRSVQIAEGAIVVQGSLNPARTALDVLSRVAEVVAG